MPAWLAVILDIVAAAPTIEDSLSKLWQGIHNEMTNGSGSTNPVGVTQAVLDNADAIAAAVKGEAPAIEKIETDVATAVAGTVVASQPAKAQPAADSQMTDSTGKVE
jgi:hypothetical protein